MPLPEPLPEPLDPDDDPDSAAWPELLPEEEPVPDVLDPEPPGVLESPEPKVEEPPGAPLLPLAPVDEPVVELPVEVLRSQAASEADRPMATAVMNKPFAMCMMDPSIRM